MDGHGGKEGGGVRPGCGGGNGRVKRVVRGKDARDVDVGRGRFVIGTKSGLEVWGYAGEEVK